MQIIKTKKADRKKFLLIALATYFFFFYQNLNPNLTIYSGKDTTNYHYPNRYYLYEKLREGEVPFWTERIFAGFPIYADLERGILHPLNLILVYLLGPVFSYKVLHLSFYLLGSYGLYALLKRKGIEFHGYFVANLIYFFSFFNLFHQQHFSFILATYLFPLLIYLTDLFLEKKSNRLLFLMVLVVGTFIYFGSAQTSLILLLGQFFYFLANHKQTKVIKFYLIYGVLLFAISLPLIFPAMELVKNSIRYDISHTEGSFNALDLSNLLYPFPYGEQDEYFGTSMFGDHLKHETYVYFGITSFLLAIWGYFRADPKIRMLVNYIVTAFLVLGFIRYVPLLNKWAPPPLSYFRYWGRISILVAFAAALLAGTGLQNFRGKVKRNINKKWFAVWGLLIAVTSISWLIQAEIKKIMWIIKQNFSFNQSFVIWLLLISGLTIVIANRKKLNEKVSRYIITTLVAIDLGFFGFIMLKNDFVEIKDLFIPREAFKNVRVLNLSDEHSANKGLYYGDWGLFGYTPLVDSNYVNQLREAGIESEKRPPAYILPETIPKITELGVQKIVKGQPIFQTGINTLIKNKDIRLQEFEIKEGLYIAKITTEKPTQIETYIRNYKDWQITVNSKEVKTTSGEDDLFVNFPLGTGIHLVKMEFVPKTLYRAILWSISIILITTYFIRKKRNELI